MTVGYISGDGATTVVVKDVDFALEPGKILGLAGESGCGKSTAALAAIGFPIPGSVRLGGKGVFGNIDLLAAPSSTLRKTWGRQISYVAQDAAAALSPLRRIARLLAEPLALHLGMSGAAVHARSVELLDSVGIPDPELALRRYPHQFSGGQQQRIAIAIAMACRPKVLLLDEPTTGLDVTTQARMSRLIATLVEESGTAALSISHDLALLATVCDEIAIMYAGEIIERGSAKTIYAAPRHPYAAALIDAVPRVDQKSATVGIPGLPPPQVIENRCSFSDRCRFVVDLCQRSHPSLVAVGVDHAARCLRVGEIGVVPSQRRPSLARPRSGEQQKLLDVRELRCVYRGRRETVAVDRVSLTVRAAETLALVGESGSGKSTLLRAIAGLHIPAEGTIAFEDQLMPPKAVKRSRELRRAVQLVFQNPDSSLNPRHTIASILDRPLALFRSDLTRNARRQRALDLLADVRLDRSVLSKYPHQLSGGQKQRIALARAFAAEPKLILCDEVVSSLDVSVQASILELLDKLARERRTALLFVTHDLAVVRTIAERVCVMRDGRIHETGTTDAVFTAPVHEYTRDLLAAVPRPDFGRLPGPLGEIDVLRASPQFE